MLMTAVVLPDAFAATHFADPAYHQNTEMFLRGIDSNGLILVDAEERLYHQLCDTVDPLAGIGKGKNTHALFEELLKKRRQKVLRFVKTGCSVNSSRPTADVATNVVSHCGADALLVDPVYHSTLASGGPVATAVIPVPDYNSSPFEAERRRCTEKLPPVDLMPAGGFDDLIRRCTCYSRWLRLFDKQLGKGNNLSHFRRGLDRILQIWIRVAHFPKKELHAEIYTVIDDSSYATFSPAVAYNRVTSDLVEPLATDLGLRIDLHFKKDDKGICHARHLQTQGVAISFCRPCGSRGDKAISQNSQFPKFEGRFDQNRSRNLPETTPNCEAQNAKAKSIKARIARLIAKLVKREGLDYNGWRYVARQVRRLCQLRPAKKGRKLPRILNADEFRKFYTVVDQAENIQHSLMLRLLFYTAVRVSELCAIEITDIDLENCKVRINQGKGSKDRYVLFGKSFATALRTHIAAHPRHRWLFQTRLNGKFTARRVQQIVKVYAEMAEVRATPHTFRHQAITWLTRHSGLADAELQLITGHARRETLAIYQHVALDGDLERKYQATMKDVEL